MKAKPSLLLSVLLFLCAIGQVVYGQYAPRFSPSGMPMGPYGPQFAPAYAAPPPATYPVAFGQVGPVVQASHFAVPQENLVDQASLRTVDGGEPPFRVFLAKEDVPDRQITLVSAMREDGKHGRYGGKSDGKSCKDDSSYCFRAFGEYLYLRARDAEVAYGVEANSGIGPVPIQVSPIALLDQDFSSGVRAGFGFCFDECSEIVLTYTLFETATTDTIVSGPPITQIIPMVIHPSTPAAVVGTVAAVGRHDIEFDLFDLDYRRVWWESFQGNVNWVAGVRYGQMEQNFGSIFSDSLAPPIVNEVAVTTDIDFNGVGMHLGLEGEQYASRLPFMVYGKCFASLLAGEFDASYRQTVQANANFGVDTHWTAGRIVPTFDLEIGGGFVCCEGSLRATAGYMFSAWTNVVKTDDFIHAVQTNDFRDMSDTMTFDGIVARIEGRF